MSICQINKLKNGTGTNLIKLFLVFSRLVLFFEVNQSDLANSNHVTSNSPSDRNNFEKIEPFFGINQHGLGPNLFLYKLHQMTLLMLMVLVLMAVVTVMQLFLLFSSLQQIHFFNGNAICLKVLEKNSSEKVKKNQKTQFCCPRNKIGGESCFGANCWFNFFSWTWIKLVLKREE